jgi:hypothetical protein
MSVEVAILPSADTNEETTAPLADLIAGAAGGFARFEQLHGASIEGVDLQAGRRGSQVAVLTISTKMKRSVTTWAIQGASRPPDRSRKAPRSTPYTEASPTPTGP